MLRFRQARFASPLAAATCCALAASLFAPAARAGGGGRSPADVAASAALGPAGGVASAVALGSTRGATPGPARGAALGSALAERADRARALFAQGEDQLRGGDVEAALATFRASNGVVRSPQAMHRIAVCLDRAGEWGEASKAYHTFLALPPPASMTDERAQVDRRVVELEQGTLRVTSSPRSVSLEIDGAPAEATPTATSLSPGKHLVRAWAPGYEEAKAEVEVVAGQEVALNVELKAQPTLVAPPPPQPAQPPPPAPPWPSRTSAYAMYALSAVALGVGVGYGARAISTKNDYDRSPSADVLQKHQDSALVADTAFGAAIVLGVVGTVFLVNADAKPAPHHHHPHSARLSLLPMLSPRSQGAAAVLRF